VGEATLKGLAVALALTVWAGGCALGPDSSISDANLPAAQVGSLLKRSAPAETATTSAFSGSVRPAKDPVSLATKATPSPGLYVAAARLSEQAGRAVEAEGHYQKALQIDPRHADALVGYARLKDRQGELQEAVELYRRAAKAYPKDPSILNDLGLCLARQRRFAESITALEEAIRLAPKEWRYRNNVAMILVETGEVEAAVSRLKSAQGEAVAHYNVGYLLQKKGDSEAAARHFAKALEKNPSLVAARIWLEKLGGEPCSVAESAPLVASERQVDDASTDRTGQPALPRGEGDAAKGPAAPVLPQPQRYGQPTPRARQLPPVTDHSPNSAPLPRQLSPLPRYDDPAPLPPPSSIGQPSQGADPSRAGVSVVHPLPPTDAAEAWASRP